jgi:hypothetical protein
MKTTKHSASFKVKDVEAIQKELDAFKFNFGYEPVLHRYSHGAIEIYTTEQTADNWQYVYRCDDIMELKGWLYGAVQAKAKMLDRPGMEAPE